MYQLQPHNAAMPSARILSANRPHLYPGGATFNISFRLYGSITRPAYLRCAKLWQQFHGQLPFEVYWEATAEEREGFRQMAAGYHDRRSLNGPFHLHHDATCRQILIDAFAFREGEHYETLAYSIMPNHVHWVVRHLSTGWTMGQLIANLKRHVARQSNLHLGLTGKPYWQPESWDRFIRNQQELERSVRYTLLNPVQCHLADDWRKWPGNYAHPHCQAFIHGA